MKAITESRTFMEIPLSDGVERLEERLAIFHQDNRSHRDYPAGFSLAGNNLGRLVMMLTRTPFDESELCVRDT